MRSQSDTGQGCGLLRSLPSDWRLLFQGGSAVADELVLAVSETSVLSVELATWLPEQPQDTLVALLRVTNPREQGGSALHFYPVNLLNSFIISSSF